MTNREVVECFLRGESGGNYHLMSTGSKLYSYNTVIAQYYNGALIGNATKYSVTSSKHISHIKQYVDGWTNNNVPIGTDDLGKHLGDSTEFEITKYQLGI